MAFIPTTFGCNLLRTNESRGKKELYILYPRALPHPEVFIVLPRRHLDFLHQSWKWVQIIKQCLAFLCCHYCYICSFFHPGAWAALFEVSLLQRELGFPSGHNLYCCCYTSGINGETRELQKKQMEEWKIMEGIWRRLSREKIKYGSFELRVICFRGFEPIKVA